MLLLSLTKQAFIMEDPLRTITTEKIFSPPPPQLFTFSAFSFPSPKNTECLPINYFRKTLVFNFRYLNKIFRSDHGDGFILFQVRNKFLIQTNLLLKSYYVAQILSCMMLSRKSFGHLYTIFLHLGGWACRTLLNALQTWP